MMRGTVLWPHATPPRGVPAAAPSDDPLPALLQAAARGDVMAVEALLARHPGLERRMGAQPGQPGVRTALHAATAAGQEGTTALLLARGADPNARVEGDGATPLHLAVGACALGVTRLLVAHGADLAGAGSYRGLDVLGWATCRRRTGGGREMVDYLLAHGARWSIWSAVAMGESGAVRRIVARDRTALIRRMDQASRRRTPLHLAAERGHAETAATLLELGAAAEARDADGYTPLDRAALAGARQTAELLLARGAVLGLPAAVGLGRARQLEVLLRGEPSCLTPGGRWETLIVRAAERAPAAIVELLLKHGASANARDVPESAVDGAVGYTALHAAAWHGNREAAAVLLRYGADVNARESRYGETAAGWARRAGHADVQVLLLAGAIDLFSAVEFGLVDRIGEIVERDPGALERRFGEVVACGAELEAGGKAGWMTALGMAVGMGRKDVVWALLACGAEGAGSGVDERMLAGMGRGRKRDVELMERRASR